MGERLFFLFFVFIILFSSLKEGGEAKKREGSSHKGNCEICNKFVENFEHGLKDTENNSFAGGDTSWEEDNKKIYSKSELRLVEIMDGVCSTNDYQCSRFVETYEEDIERWWLKLKENGHPDLRQWLCYTHADVCCPPGTYGPECAECPGGKDNPCNSHGTCKGEGEKDLRKGSGTCACNSGYHGDFCDSCKPGYYLEDGGNNCRRCHRACLKTCNGSGPDSCDECAKGYKRDEEGGDCEDINECDDDDETAAAYCTGGTYCVNKPGTYECEKCDRSCKHSCTGPGHSSCIDCANGYRNESGNCQDINECVEGMAKCKDGTYCDNNLGSFLCKDCDSVCDGLCTGEGPGGCVSCKDGYKMEDGRCEDVNECTVSSPCDEDSENCINVPGGYSCKCKAGYTRFRGDCVLWEDADRLRNQDIPPTNKKNKKKSVKSKPQVEEGERDHERLGRVNFPWYHLLLPTAIWYLGYKYVRPTLATTVAMAFGISAIYMLGNKFDSHSVN